MLTFIFNPISSIISFLLKNSDRIKLYFLSLSINTSYKILGENYIYKLFHNHNSFRKPTQKLKSDFDLATLDLNINRIKNS